MKTQKEDFINKELETKCRGFFKRNSWKQIQFIHSDLSFRKDERQELTGHITVLYGRKDDVSFVKFFVAQKLQSGNLEIVASEGKVFMHNIRDFNKFLKDFEI